MVNFLNYRWIILVSGNFLISLNTTLLLETVHYLRKSTLLLKTIHYLRTSTINVSNPTKFLIGNSQPNPTHVEYTNIVVKKFLHYYRPISYLYDFLAIAPKDISCWEYYLVYPNKWVKPNIFQPTVLPEHLYSGEVSHHK